MPAPIPVQIHEIFTRGDEKLSQEYEWFDLLVRLHTWAPGYYCMIGNLVH